MAVQALDLTQRAPRSPRVRLGGYVILPRMLDKGRATINNKPASITSIARWTGDFWRLSESRRSR